MSTQLQTHIAHCGGCGEIMVLCRYWQSIDWTYCYWIYWYVCHFCGVETPARLTVAEADADAVWVPVKPAKKGKDRL